MTLSVNTALLKEKAPTLCCGDKVLLSGTVYTARDAVHKKIQELIEKGGELPFQIEGACIYYSGPTPAKVGTAIGSCGPTTSSRMDKFTPALLDMGLIAMIGKGPRSEDVVSAIVRNKAVYFVAIGGAGAIASERIVSSEVVAFPELGCESVKKLVFDSFPVFVAIDSEGNSIFER